MLCSQRAERSSSNNATTEVVETAAFSLFESASQVCCILAAGLVFGKCVRLKWIRKVHNLGTMEWVSHRW